MVTEVKPNNVLITNATVLTLDDDYTIIDNGAVAIEGDRITAVAQQVYFCVCQPSVHSWMIGQRFCHRPNDEIRVSWSHPALLPFLDQLITQLDRIVHDHVHIHGELRGPWNSTSPDC